MKAKSTGFIVFGLLLTLPAIVMAGVTLPLGKAVATDLTISSNTATKMNARNTIGEIRLENQETPEGVFTTIIPDGYVNGDYVPGDPQLPVMTRLIEIPAGADVEVLIHASEHKEIHLGSKGLSSRIMPAQPPRSKSMSEGNHPFYINKKAYKKTDFNRNALVSFQKIGVMKGVTIGRLTISPFRYNPSRSLLRVFDDIRFELVYKNGSLARTREMKKRYPESTKTSVLQTVEPLMESDPVAKSAIETGGVWPLTYAIVADNSFNTGETAGYDIEDFIRWKREEGYNVQVLYTDSSTKADSLRSGVKDFLTGLSPLPSYLLLIGDHDLLPAYPGVTKSHVTDLYYCTFDGESDTLPDAFYGRFPADDQADLAAMIEKTLQYEMFDFSSASASDYLDNSLFIAGADSDSAERCGDAQVLYAVAEYFPDAFSYLYYDGSGYPSRNITPTIKTHFNNDGLGIINYTGHCSETALAIGNTTSDQFDNGDITDLSNEDAYGLMIGNCCLSNKFDYNDSFGETIVKAEASGTIGYIGASNETFWEEDFCWAVGKPDLTLNVGNKNKHRASNTGTGIYDALWHTTPETSGDPAEWYITAGQIFQRGNMAVTAAGFSAALYYWEIYHLMGDPSLMPYLYEPSVYSSTPTLTPDNPSGEFTACVTGSCDVSGLETHSYVSLSQDGNLIAAGYSGSNSSLILPFVRDIEALKDLKLVVRKQNKQPKTIGSITTVGAGDVNAPTADFTFSRNVMYSGASASFKNKSLGCNITAYNWTFEGGLPATSTSEDPSVQYKNIGSFHVELTVSNSEGADSKSDDIVINPNLFVNPTFGILDAEGKCKVIFQENSGNQFDVDEWVWTISGITTQSSTYEKIEREYTEPGEHTVSLIAKIDGVEYSSKEIGYKVRKPFPVAKFTASKTDINIGETITFTSTSENEIETILWRFEKGGQVVETSTETNPVVQYDSSGENLKVSLIVSNTSVGHTKTDTSEMLINVIDPDAPSVPGSGGGGGGSCFIANLN